MKIINPSLIEIQNLFFNYGKCSITLTTGQIIYGIFTKEYKPEHIIIGWYFNALPEKQDVYVPHNEILLIERLD